MTLARLLLSAAALSVLAGSPVVAQQAAPVAVARSEAPLASLTADQRVAAVARIKQIVQQRYVFPDRVPAILARLDQGLASGRYDAAEPRTFADRLTEDLRESSGDRHMYVNFDPAQYAAAISGPSDPEARNPALEALLARGAVRDNHGLSDMRILPGNVRYLRWAQPVTAPARPMTPPLVSCVRATPSSSTSATTAAARTPPSAIWSAISWMAISWR
jgi:hypothetical protein